MYNFEVLLHNHIKKILISPEYLKIITDKGSYAWEAVGECCSDTYIQDFSGVNNLLEGKVLEVKAIDLGSKEKTYGLTRYYGIKFTIESDKFGEVTAVLSFRNESNGYYGGDLDQINSDLVDDDKLMDITTDWNEDMYLL